MPRASKPRAAKRRAVRSRTNTTSPGSDNQEVVFIAENIEKKIGKYKSLLEDIQTTPDFRVLPETLRYEIKRSLSSSTFTKSSIAFIGESGSGKSTTINALLGKQLLPTDSSGEACTAIPIEIHSSKGNGFYGYVKFVSLDTWREEVQQGQNILRNDADDDAEENEKLLEKIKLVYPHLTLKDLKEMTIDTILAQNEAAQVLEANRTEQLPNSHWDEFTSALYEHVVPSRKRSQIWPLVEMVELYVDSPILRNGLVLVDVPGVLDSNRTRADRAQEYIQASAAVCIVTCAQRCISNATSYDLIRDVLEQVQYNGHLDRIVLINSKSDDFEADQVRDRLDDPAIWEAHTEHAKAYEEFSKVSEDLRNARTRLDENGQISMQSKNGIKAYKSKLTRLGKSQPVYDTPQLETARRKETRSPLTKSIVQARIRDFETQKDNAEKLMLEIGDSIAVLETAFEEKKAQHEILLQCYYKQCLLARNNEAKEQQRNKVIKIVKQCDEAVAISSQSAGDTQNIEVPDEVYETRKEQIPVFCVSAKVSLHLQNVRIYEDISTKKISNEEDTGIPALSEHLMSLAKSVRGERLDDTLRALGTAFSSVLLHVKDTLKPQPVDSDAANRAVSEAEVLLRELHAGFNESFKSCSSSIRSHFHTHVRNKLNSFIKVAVSGSSEMLEVLGECPTAHKKTGLYPGEYKAVVFGDGLHAGKRIKVNFNKKIVRCLQKVLYPSMKQLYLGNNSQSEQEIRQIVNICLNQFEDTHNQMRRLADAAGVSPFAFEVVEDQFQERKTALRRMQIEVYQSLKDAPSKSGKELSNRIKNELRVAYSRARDVGKGFGMLRRMSSEVVTGIQRGNGTVIDRCLHELDTKLYQVTGEALDVLGTRLEDFSNSVSQNYQDAFRHRDQDYMSSNHPAIRRMLLMSGLVSHKQLTESDKMFIDETAGIKLEATDTNIEMSDGQDQTIEDTSDMMEGVDARAAVDPLNSSMPPL